MDKQNVIWIPSAEFCEMNKSLWWSYLDVVLWRDDGGRFVGYVQRKAVPQFLC